MPSQRAQLALPFTALVASGTKHFERIQGAFQSLVGKGSEAFVPTCRAVGVAEANRLDTRPTEAVPAARRLVGLAQHQLSACPRARGCACCAAAPGRTSSTFGGDAMSILTSIQGMLALKGVGLRGRVVMTMPVPGYYILTCQSTNRRCTCKHHSGWGERASPQRTGLQERHTQRFNYCYNSRVKEQTRHVYNHCK